MTTLGPASGEQYELSHGSMRAVIASVGASLRVLQADGRDLIVPFAADEVRPAFRGATVAPWPNRVVDGRYRFGGKMHQLPLTEVDRHHALHGFTPWLKFDRVATDEPGADGAERVPGAGASVLVLCATVEPQSGYPWRINVESRFELDDSGLTQTVVATNLSTEDAPYGVCPHPYLRAGDGPIDRWELTLPAERVLTVSEPRLIPLGLKPVTHDASRFDFRQPRQIGSARIDHAFTGLERTDDGSIRVEVRVPGEGGVGMEWDEACEWVQIHTADLPGAPSAAHRVGLAVEPMTCAPDAFNGGPGRGLVHLAPGARHTASWRIEAIGDGSGEQDRLAQTAEHSAHVTIETR